MSLGVLETSEFADNAEARCPVVLMLDCSYSMGGPPIDQLNAGVALLATELKADPLASLRVEIAVVTFGGSVEALDVRTGSGTVPFDAEQTFVTADQFVPPTLHVTGDTPLGEATRRTLDLLRDRKAIYRTNGIRYYRPWVFLITDGAPNDIGWEAAADQANAEEGRNGVSMFAIGVTDADMQILARFTSQRPPLLLTGLNFREFFLWLSESLVSVSKSKPGDQVPLPTVNWGTVPV